MLASEEIVVTLRVDNADRRDGHALVQKLLVGGVPLTHRDGRLVHAPVFVVRIHVMPPGLNAAGKRFDRPEAQFRLGPGRQAEAHACRVVEGHALGCELVPSEESVNQLAGLAVRLEAGGISASLAVEHDHLGASTDFAIVAERHGGS